ncbi:RNA polymerase sigma-70 factor [Mariniphaga sediminis]|uniref:RNA polymerase sigma-70 factor n=1 Tax=Mariniphaga sediminis TaxID=1628158 RepID=UPI001559B093|nr:RNA polymerase sigma-70 factor [Mariniphaga sediminis]
MKIEDRILLNEIKNRNRKVFESLFYEYYPHLVRYAEGFVFDRQVCEDIVQNLLIYFWERTDLIKIEQSIKAYFYQSVKNRCLNYLRDIHIQDKHKLLYLESMLNDDDSATWLDPEIIMHIEKAIERLPLQMASLFRLKYVDGKKYREIATEKKISENTVKTQIQRAKEKLRNLLLESTSIKFFL